MYNTYSVEKERNKKVKDRKREKKKEGELGGESLKERELYN